MNIKKTLLVSLAATAGLALLGLTGCSKMGGNIDTSKVQSAFETAPPVDKTEVQNAIAAVKAKDYSGALVSCKKVITSAKLNEEQKSALQDLISQIQTKGLGLAKEAVGGVGGATNQIQGAGHAPEGLTNTLQP